LTPQCRAIHFPKHADKRKEKAKILRRDNTRKRRGEKLLSQLLHHSHDGDAESR
jgi:hypothetical protein